MTPSPFTRRSFLAAGAAGLAATTVLGQPPAGQPPAQPPAQPAVQEGGFGDFIFGVQSYTFRQFNLERTLQSTRQLGLHFIELNHGHLPLASTEAQINAARRLCFDNGITPIAYGVEGFTNNHDANRAKFEFARKLGVRYLSADPDPNSFDSLDRLVSEFGIAIAIHPHGPQGQGLHRWYGSQVILPAVRTHHRLIGTCLDTGHLIRSAQPPHNRNLDPAAEVRAMGARNFGLHLKDHDNTRRTDVPFGAPGGVLNVQAVLRALREVHFDGYISIEYEASPANPMDDMRVCVTRIREAVAALNR